jgi:general transcription factor 3C polypeptide 5 (transcription factor C subunit 1)
MTDLLLSYRQNASVRIFKDQTGADISINDARPNRIIHSIVPYDVIEVPKGPSVHLPPEKGLEIRLRRIINVLRDGLKDRPIMSTRYQSHLTGEPLYGAIRKALPYVGYIFRGGPFKDALIQYGLDPRSDPFYRVFQVTQVQIPGTDRKLSRFGAGPPKGKDKLLTYVFDGTEIYTDAKVFHFCDITDPVLQKLISNAPVAEKFDVSIKTQQRCLLMLICIV